MPIKKAVISTLFSALSLLGFSQKAHEDIKAIHPRTRVKNNATLIKEAKARTLCPIFETSKYPFQGIGFKLGDPFALTYKFYFNRHFSIAADVGEASSGLYTRYYRDKFSDYIKTDTLQPGGNITYLTHKIKSDWVGEVKFLYSISGKNLAPGLQLYVGAGLQARRTNLQYNYLYSGGALENVVGRFEQTRFTVGQTTIVGIEYSYFHLPISAFMEMELFTDVMKDPGWKKAQGGAGLRYVFKTSRR